MKDEEEIVLTAEARGNGPPWEGILHISIWTYEDSGVTREHMGMCVKLARVRLDESTVALAPTAWNYMPTTTRYRP